jgi:hypothetical protein
MPVIILPTEESPFTPGPGLFPSVKIAASLSSMDTHETLTFDIPPSEHERSFGSDWAEAEVAQAAVQFSEYRQTPPEERTYKVTFDAYRRRGGEANDIEAEYQKLKRFVTTGPAPRRAHRLVFSQRGLVFRCYLKHVSMPVRRISRTGGALQALECQITLVELHL